MRRWLARLDAVFQREISPRGIDREDYALPIQYGD
jgi:hypothetical protein